MPLRNATTINKKTAVIMVMVLTVVFVVVGARSVYAEWREPQLAPPQQQFPAPLTTGGENQVKEGYLLIDPEYNPTQETSLNFNPQRPLDVRGTGSRFSTPDVYNDILRVDGDSLFADASANWVGIGTATSIPGYQLVVDSGTVQVGDEIAPVSGVGVRGYGTSVGIYGDADTLGIAGVYGLNTANNGWAVRGESDDNVGVRGESDAGYGIYGSTQSQSFSAVYGQNMNNGWAGYFSGKLGSAADIVTERFIATYLPTSVAPFTAGQKLGYYQVSSGDTGAFFVPSLAFDGTFIWATNKSDDHSGNNLYKIRVSDGRRIASYHVEGLAPEPHDIAFDGRYLWLASTGISDHSVIKVDPQNGERLAICSTLGSTSNWGSEPDNIIIQEENGEIFIWTSNTNGADLTKFDRNCNQVGVYPLGTTGVGDELNRLNDDGWRIKPAGIAAGADSIWVTTPSLCGTTPPSTVASCIAPAVNCFSGNTCQVFNDNLLQIDPSTGTVINRVATGLQAPGEVLFDGKYVWVVSTTSSTEGLISKIRASDRTIMPGYPQALSSSTVAMATDGNNIWLASSGGNVDQGDLRRVNIATDSITTYVDVVSTNYWSNDMIFDGANLWTLAACTDAGSCAGGNSRPLRLTKNFAGVGYGHSDVNTVVNRTTSAGSCVNPFDPPASTNIECLYDWHCPAITGTFGTGGTGVLEFTAFTPGRIAKSVANDGIHMYLAGTDDSFDFRIQKRKLFDGTLCTDTNECAGSGFGYDATGTYTGDGTVVGDAASQDMGGISIDSTYMYVAGTDSAGNWRIEKRLLSTGEACSASACGTEFGTGGIVTGDATTNAMRAITIDGSFMYLVGSNDTNDWRIEKRLLSTGALDTTFDGDGIFEYSLNATIVAHSIVVDSTYMYIVGESAPDYWRIEKRNKTTGALDTGFDGDGIVDGGTLSGRYPTDISIDSTYMYVVGNYSRIEKRLLTTGALDTTFDGDGIVESADTLLEIPAITIDANYLYMVGRDLNTDNWGTEKRLLSDGSLHSSFGTNGVILGDAASRQAFDVSLDSNDYMYIVGSSGNVSSVQEWRIEKRQALSAALGNTDDNETCNANNGTQPGNINVGGDVMIKHGHCEAAGLHYYSRTCTTDAACSDLVNGTCAGGNINVGSDITASSNVWSAASEAATINTGVVNCTTNGYFMTSVTLDAGSLITDITCRGL